MTFSRSVFAILALPLSGCGYGGAAMQTAPGSQVGGTGDIQFSHADLGGKMHSLTVAVRPGVLETDGSMSQRNISFATKFAADACPSGFEFVTPPSPEMQTAQRTRSYTFRCR